GRAAGGNLFFAPLLVDRRGGVEQQRGQVPDLLLGERARVAEARHLRAGVVGLRVPDLAVHVALGLRRVAARLAEAREARADGAVRLFLRRDLVAVVAAAARLAGLVAPGHAAAALRDALPALPVAEQAAGG